VHYESSSWECGWGERGGKMLQETGDAGSAAMGSPVSPEQVLKTLMNDGHFDSLRIKILNQLKQSVR
jgi:hypothetical protein